MKQTTLLFRWARIMKRLLGAVMIGALVMSALWGCRSEPERVRVHSSDYASLQYLEPGEFDREQSLYWNLPENPYHAYRCHISVSEEGLLISNQSGRQETYLTQFDNGYFIGVDLGEFDGWVRYVPYFSTLPEAGDSVLVSDENCRGILAKDRRNGYLLTGDALAMTGSIYLLQCSDAGDQWTWKLLAALEELPLACTYEKEQELLYVVTSGSILSVSADQQVSTLVRSGMFNEIGANSVVFYEDSFWCGSPMGVYRYCVQTGEEIWYPMDYAAYVG